MVQTRLPDGVRGPSAARPAAETAVQAGEGSGDGAAHGFLMLGLRGAWTRHACE